MDPLVESRLITECRNGNREAFRPLVEQYQSLICALGYSASGNVGLSEDIAQETFLIAWKQLPQLREPARFKAWLCGIARNLIQNHLRRDRRSGEVQSTEALEHVDDPNPQPAEAAIRSEEEALVWQALSAIPDPYREPIVMYYREDQSIEAVAAALDLSEVAVRQRLSRGRAMLREQVAALVETTLTRTRPGPSLTISTLALIPMTPGKVAIAVGSAQGMVSGAAKVAGVAKWVMLGPVLLSSLSLLLGIREERRHRAAHPPSAAFRRLVVRVRWIGLAAAAAIGLILGPAVALRSLRTQPSTYPDVVEIYLRATDPAWMSVVIPVLCIGFVSWSGRRLIQQQQEDQRASQPGSATTEPSPDKSQAALTLRLTQLAISMIWPAVVFASISFKTVNWGAGSAVLAMSAAMVAICCWQCRRAQRWHRPLIGATWLGLVFVLLVAVPLTLPAWRDAGVVEPKWTPALTECLVIAYFAWSAMSWQRHSIQRPLGLPSKSAEARAA